MVKFNKDKTKILIPIKQCDDNNQSIRKYVYVPYPNRSRCEINSAHYNIYSQYGYTNKADFIRDVQPLAEEKGYSSVWHYAIDCAHELRLFYDFD